MPRTRPEVRIAGLCGSLRANSVHARVLKATRTLFPEYAELETSDLPARLPLFNPDLEADPPRTVTSCREWVAACDGLLLASPEYAHGISAHIKNTLEWLVSVPAATDKPVLVINARAGAHHADAALREVLRTMGVVLLGDRSVQLPAFPANLSAGDIAATPDLAQRVQKGLESLFSGVAESRIAPRS
ncbi:NADPH-dependent FMN reductase [Phycisphaera mikurensis]|uniref:NADPH-dependent FMN reductase n=1 Tax=Phycisphaera mikurensis TaxID=547188 RepID=UPI0009461EB5